ncbi:hypothetical protein [Streptomyces sp. NPDC017529]|uniref:hypothetical protein n=1 Tax=Streptomyces sp. NPDC017529 TaxID=3365000 RepID=UPI0037B30E55
MRVRRAPSRRRRRSWADIRLHDRRTGEQLQIDTTADGLPATSGSTDPLLSADGRTAVFESRLDDVVAGDTNHETDVFLRHVRCGSRRTHTPQVTKRDRCSPCPCRGGPRRRP